MARIQQIKHPDGDVIYPISHTNAIIDDSGNRLENVLQDLKQNSSIWNIELGSGVFVNRPDLLVDIKLGSGVWIGSDAPIFISSNDGIKISDSIRITQMRGIEISNSIKICTDIYIGSDVYIGTSPLDSNGGVYIGTDVYIDTDVHIGNDVYIGTDVYIERGFDSRNISGSGGGGLWKVENNLLISQDSNRNIQLGPRIYIGTQGSVIIDGNIHGIKVDALDGQNTIWLGSHVQIGAHNERVEITEKGIEILNHFDKQCVFIGSDVYIDNEFDTRNYFDVNANLHPECIPTDSSLKNSSQLAVNIEPQSNGNIKIGDTLFMPATPSGDPMHYAYETAGAEYNATTDFIVKDAPWKNMVDTIEDKAKWGFDVVDASQVKQMTIGGTTYNYVQTTRQSPQGTTEPRYYLVGQASDGTWVEDETKVLHLPGHWYLNGLGDITNKEMRRIDYEKEVKYRWDKARAAQGTKARTTIAVDTVSNIDMISILSTPYWILAEAICITNSSPYSVIEGACAIKVNPTGTSNKTKYVQTCKSATGTPFDKARVISFIDLKENCSLTNVINISKPSLLYTINNAKPTAAITITLHADRYAQLSEDADIVAALQAKNAALEGTGGSISLVSA